MTGFETILRTSIVASVTESDCKLGQCCKQPPLMGVLAKTNPSQEKNPSSKTNQTTRLRLNRGKRKLFFPWLAITQISKKSKKGKFKAMRVKQCLHSRFFQFRALHKAEADWIEKKYTEQGYEVEKTWCALKKCWAAYVKLEDARRRT